MADSSQYYRVGGVRFGNIYEDPTDDGHDTLQEAVEWCYREIEDNHSSPSYIICPDGRVVGWDELYLLMCEYEKSL